MGALEPRACRRVEEMQAFATGAESERADGRNIDRPGEPREERERSDPPVHEGFAPRARREFDRDGKRRGGGQRALARREKILGPHAENGEDEAGPQACAAKMRAVLERQAGPLGAHGKQVHGRGPEKARGGRRRRAGVELVGAARGDDPAAVEQHEAVGERQRLGLVLQRKHRGRAGLAPQRRELEAQRRALGGVEAAERLVEQQSRRPGREGARERGPRPFARGDSACAAGERWAEAEGVGCAQGGLLRVPALQAAGAEPPDDVVIEIASRLERVRIDEFGELGPSDPPGLADVLADLDHAGVRLLAPRDEAQERRLAGARRADQRAGGPRRDLERDVVERLAAASQGSGDVGDDDRGQASKAPAGRTRPHLIVTRRP